MVALDVTKKYNLSLNDIINPWVYAGLINIAAYGLALLFDGKILGVEVIKFGARLNGFFKDPNVSGPFLIIPTIYYLNKMQNEKTISNALMFFVFSMGVALSMSRAAWLNILIASMSLIFLKGRLKNKFVLILTRSLSLLLLILVIKQNEVIYNIFSSRFGLQSYDEM